MFCTAAFAACSYKPANIPLRCRKRSQSCREGTHPCSSLQPQSIILQARYPPNPSNITSTQPLPPPRTSIIDQYKCDYLLHRARFASTCPPSSSESSDHDAALDEQTIAAMCDAAKHVSETGKGRGFLKLRRQQKRLEVIAPLSRARTEISLFLTVVQSVKVAKKPKSYAQTAVNDQDEDDVVEDAEPSLEGNGESKDKKSFNFTGDVLYSVCAASAENNTVFFSQRFAGGWPAIL